MSAIKKVLLFLLLPFLVTVLATREAYAISCEVSGGGATINLGQEGLVSITISSSGPEDATYVSFENPDTSAIEFRSGSASGWSSAISDNRIIFSGGSIPSEGSLTFSISVLGLAVTESEVQMDGFVSIDGGSYDQCYASAGVSVVDIFTLSDISLSANNSSASIAWTSSEPASSSVSYGTTASYGSTAGDSDLSTSHSVSLTGLSASTTYYYQVCSTNEGGQQSCSGQNTFTTGSASSTTTSTTTTVVATTTTSTTTSPRPVATPIPVERTPPVVLITTEFDKPFTEAPKIDGRASDNKDLAKIEYSTDGGENWLPVDELKDLGAKATDFSFTPFLTEDGNYEIVARALDSAGNIGTSSKHTLVIDRLPPRVGGNIIALGPHLLTPNKDGTIITLAGLETKISLSSVGGVTTMDLLSNNQMFSLSHSPDTGLWNGSINFTSPGEYKLLVRAEDGAGNKTERALNHVVVLSPGGLVNLHTGKVLKEGTITLYYKDPLTAQWTIWDAASFGQVNPQKLDKDGNYRLYLPAGIYYVETYSPGYARYVSRIFEVKKPTPLNADFRLKPARKFGIGPFSFTLPDFLSSDEEISVKVPKFNGTGENPLVGKEAPLFTLESTAGEQFELTSLRGSLSIVTFINTWSSQSIEQVSILADALAAREIEGVLVSTQESLYKSAVFLSRGGYKVPIIVDPDGTLIDAYNITTVPTHFFLDRKGVIAKVVPGVLNEKEIKEFLIPEP